MIRKTGDMWSIDSQQDHIIICTTNNVINASGELIMGGGTALEMSRRVRNAAAVFGHAIRHSQNPERYLLVIIGKYGVLQTKYHYRYDSTLELIESSIGRLRIFAEICPTITINVPFPGVGLGNLTEDQVGPLLTNLPDNIHVWTRR